MSYFEKNWVAWALSMYFIGVDIGGTKVSISLGNSRGEVIEKQRLSTHALGEPKSGQEKILKMIQKCALQAGITIGQVEAVGLAVPGPMSVERGMLLRPPNLPNWVDVPIRQFLKRHLSLPVFIQNDADAGALAHLEFAPLKRINHFIFLTMSTGVGGGVIIDGKLVQGKNDTVGEVGHFVLDPKGPKCMCGQNGCFEVYCGGKSIALLTQEAIRSQQVETAILQKADGRVENIDMKCIVSAAKEGDLFAVDVCNRFIERLAQGLGILIMTLNPEIVVLGTIFIRSGTYLIRTFFGKKLAYGRFSSFWRGKRLFTIKKSIFLGKKALPALFLHLLAT